MERNVDHVNKIGCVNKTAFSYVSFARFGLLLKSSAWRACRRALYQCLLLEIVCSGTFAP